MTAASNIGQRFADKGITYKTLALLDTPTQNIVQFFEEAADFIDETLQSDPKHKVLIHCFAGKSRASTITCSYLMKRQGMSLRDSLLHLRACRPIAYPNIGFLVQLKAYETKILGTTSDVPFKLWQLFGIPDPSIAAKAKNDNAELTVEEKEKLDEGLSDIKQLTSQD